MKVKEEKGIKRTSILNVFIIIAFLAIIITLITIESVNREKYKDMENIVSSYEVVVDAARGDIVDRNGNPLVTNKQGNSLIFNAAFFPSQKEQKQRNDIILKLTKLFKANKLEYNDDFPIVVGSNGEFEFQEDKDADIKWIKSDDFLKLNDYATAKNCMDEIIKKFELKGYSKLDQRDIASILVQMQKNGFSKQYPYEFATDVPTKMVGFIMEDGETYKGVQVSVDADREYPDGTVAPHILGRTTSISPSIYKEKKQDYKEQHMKLVNKHATKRELDDLERNKYAITDKYGEFGIEKYAEEYLRGTKGVKTVTVDTQGNTNESYSIEPQQGNTVILTIDKNLQDVAQKALKAKVDSMPNKNGKAPAAAAVVLDVHSGEILACATYPSYDISQYAEKYSDLAKDENVPLWNRALRSTYQPGSTFKPLVALAGLETGTINENTIFTCHRIFDYHDHIYKCTHNHGPIDVKEAIHQSCNIFFYKTGDKLGIKKIDEYGSIFGLGQKTGVELPEAEGVIASPEYRKSVGGKWWIGDTVQAAIGQSDHLFTPIQLANYVATIANGGTRYVPHFIKTIKTADNSKVVLDKGKQVTLKTSISKKNYDIVREGMLRVGTEGHCANVLKNLPVKVAAKTGTSTVRNKVHGKYIEYNNGFLISFAPYENPQIAIAVVVETAGSGASTASISRDIYDYYFKNKGVTPTQEYNQLLS